MLGVNTMRRTLIAANWKLYKTIAEARAWVTGILPLLKHANACDVVVAPPYTALSTMAHALHGSPVALAGQDLYPVAQGAYTGAVSGTLLKDVGCTYVLVGHSERRQLFGETLESSRLRLNAALAAGLIPILCVGETLAQRDAGTTDEIVSQQLHAAIADLASDALAKVVIAYEPVWAIGTGRVATPQQAQDVHSMIRAQLAQRDVECAKAMRILYGGSVKPDNAAELLIQPDIDGALVGGASLDPVAFAAIIHAGAASAQSYESWFDTQFAPGSDGDAADGKA